MDAGGLIWNAVGVPQPASTMANIKTNGARILKIQRFIFTLITFQGPKAEPSRDKTSIGTANANGVGSGAVPGSMVEFALILYPNAQ